MSSAVARNPLFQNAMLRHGHYGILAAMPYLRAANACMGFEKVQATSKSSVNRTKWPAS
jgi:hypothetical protein